MSDPSRTAIGRLAFRVEGREWVAYWAPRQDSMNGAVRLGMLAMSAAANAFMGVMKLAFTVAVREVIGQAPDWSDLKPALENERSGSA